MFVNELTYTANRTRTIAQVGGTPSSLQFPLRAAASGCGSPAVPVLVSAPSDYVSAMVHQCTATTNPRFTIVNRVFVVVFALAQLLLPGTLSVLDGIVARGSQPAVVHVEAPGSRHCPRVHQIDNCAICQFLAHASAVRPQPARGHGPARTIVVPHASRRIARVDVWRPALALPRAPPTI